MGLFGKSSEKPPKEMVQEWTSKIRKEGYSIDRQIRSIQKEEDKVKRSLKDAAKKGHKDVCVTLAKEIVNSKKAVRKLYASKAHLNSVQMMMKNQLATLRITGALEKSTEVMTSMQSLIKVPEVQATMQNMAKEMMKAGIIEEMVDDTMAGLEDEDELEEEAQEEVDKVLFELTEGQLGKAPAAVHDSLPEPAGAASMAVGGAEEEEEEPEEELDDMRARLEALRS